MMMMMTFYEPCTGPGSRPWSTINSTNRHAQATVSHEYIGATK